MKKRLSLSVAIGLLLVIGMCVSAFAQDLKVQDEASAESMMADFVFLRPLGIVATAVGVVFFVASIPFSAPTGSAGKAFDKLIADPAYFTFARPLGQID